MSNSRANLSKYIWVVAAPCKRHGTGVWSALMTLCSAYETMETVRDAKVSVLIAVESVFDTAFNFSFKLANSPCNAAMDGMRLVLDKSWASRSVRCSCKRVLPLFKCSMSSTRAVIFDASIDMLLKRGKIITIPHVEQLLKISEGAFQCTLYVSGQVHSQSIELGFHLLNVVSLGTAYRGCTLSHHESTCLNWYLR